MTPRASAATQILLVAALVGVVMTGKALAPTISATVAAAGAPKALVGVIIAAILLMPEGLAAVRAARADRLQNSLNLALGSALASIGLTIPVVAMVSLWQGLPLTLALTCSKSSCSSCRCSSPCSRSSWSHDPA